MRFFKFPDQSIRWLLAELTIVVIGVLIALAANDWYESLQLENQEIAYIQGIRDDLSNDRSEILNLIEIAQESSNVIEELLLLIDDPSLDIEDPVDFLRKLKRTTITYYFSPSTTTYNELTGGGNLSAISNRDLMRSYINYQQASLLTDDLNEVIRDVKWKEYGLALAKVIDPILLAPMTEDWFRTQDSWPNSSNIEPLNNSIEIEIELIRSSSEFRTALARSLDFTVVQQGDLYRMLQICENVLETVEQELEQR